MDKLRPTLLAVALVLGAGLSPLASAALMQYDGTGGSVPPSGTSGVFTSSIVVGDAGTVNDVSIRLNDFSHSWIGDIFATLAFDDGSNPAVSLVLFGFAGLGPSNDANGTYTFADGGAANFTTAGNPIPSGTYAPVGSFSVFNGFTSAGTWTLSLNDQFVLDAGALGSWTLNISSGGTPSPVPAPATLALLGIGLLGMTWLRRKKS